MGTKRKQHRAFPTMLSAWKQELPKMPRVPSNAATKKVADLQAVIDKLHRKFGHLQVERDFLAGQPPIVRLLKSVQ